MAAAMDSAAAVDWAVVVATGWEMAVARGLAAETEAVKGWVAVHLGSEEAADWGSAAAGSGLEEEEG